MSVFELVGELCSKVFDSEFTSKEWYPELPKIRRKALKKLKTSCYEILLHKVSSPDISYEEDWSPAAQVLGHVFTLQQQGLYKDAKKMKLCAKNLIDSNLHKDPVVLAVLDLLLRLQDSVPRTENYEQVLFRYMQPKPYDPTQGPMPYEILHPSAFEPQPWMLHLVRADSSGKGYFPASGVFPFTSEPGQDLPVLGRFLQPARSSGSGSKVALYTLPQFPALTEPRGLQIPQLIYEQKPLADEGYGTPSVEASRNASPCQPFPEDLLLAADAVWKVALSYNPPALRTWEAFGQRIVAKERPFLSEAGQEAAKHFIEVVKEWPQHHAGQRSVVSASLFVTMDQLLQDVGYLLLGVQSETFPFSEEEFAFRLAPGICVEEISILGMSTFCDELLELGTCAKRLQLLCQRGVPGHPRTQLMEALREHVNTYLQFHWGVALLMPRDTSLMALNHWTHGLHRKTVALARLCGVAPPSESWPGPRQLPSGIALVSYIYETLSVETRPDVCCMLYSTLQAVSRVYFWILQQWIFNGSLCDAWEEFFILPGPLYEVSSRDRKYWAQVFQMVRSAVPGFLHGLEDDILLCGKTIHFLKLCCPKAALCVALESGHPSIPCCLGGRELRKLSAQCRRFERRVQEVEGRGSESGIKASSSWRHRCISEIEVQERQETIRQAREQHMLRIKLEQEASRRAVVQKQLQWRAELQQQARDDQQRRREELQRERQDELKALEFDRQMQLQDQRRKQEEKQRMIEYYEELSEVAAKRLLLAEWRTERMNLRDRRKDFILSEWRATAAELNIKNLEQAHSAGSLTIIKEDSDAAKPDSPIENHENLENHENHAPALSLPLTTTNTPGENNTIDVGVNNATTTDQVSPNNNSVDNVNDRRDVNENINELILNLRKSSLNNTQLNLLDTTIEDAALGNVVIGNQDTNAASGNAAAGFDNSAFVAAAAIKAKIHDQEFGLHPHHPKDDEGEERDVRPVRMLSAAERNKQKVMEQEFGVTLKIERPKSVPFSPSMRENLRNHDLTSQSQESLRQNFQNTVSQRRANRWNMLHGDSIIGMSVQNSSITSTFQENDRNQPSETDTASTNHWNVLQGNFNAGTGDQNSLSNRNVTEAKKSEPTEMDALSKNRWNMLQGDFNIITGAQNPFSTQSALESEKNQSSEVDAMSIKETPSEDGTQPIFQFPASNGTPMSKSESSGSVNHVYKTASGLSSKTSSSYNITSITSSTSFDMGSGKFSLNTPTSTDGSDTFKTCHGSNSSDSERNHQSSRANTSIPYWKSHRLGADEEDLGAAEDLQSGHSDDEVEDSSYTSDVVDFTDFTSINVALQKSIAIPLYTQLHLANKAVLKYFFEDLDLFGHFLSLRSFLLMMDGEYSRTMTNSLFEKISTVRQPSHLLNYVVLNALLRKALDVSLNSGEENVKRLSFKVSASPEHFHLTSTDVLECLSLRYHTEWPLNVIITKESVLKYNIIFSFLIKVRLVAWRLEQCFYRLKGAGGKDFGRGSEQYHSVQVWRHEMTHFVRSFHNYIMSTAVHSTWESFEQQLNNAQTLDNVYMMHVAYMKKILFRCLLYKKCRPLHEILMNIFNTILRFQAQLEASQWRPRSLGNPTIEHPDFRTLAKIHDSFQKFADVFYKLVGKLIHSGYQPHLSELLEMLNANEHYTSSASG